MKGRNAIVYELLHDVEGIFNYRIRYFHTLACKGKYLHVLPSWIPTVINYNVYSVSSDTTISQAFFFKGNVILSCIHEPGSIGIHVVGAM